MFLRLAVSDTNATVIETSSSVSILSLVLYRLVVCRLPDVFIFLSLGHCMVTWSALSWIPWPLPCCVIKRLPSWLTVHSLQLLADYEAQQAQHTTAQQHNRRSDEASCAENGDNCRHLKIIREKSDFWCSDWSLTSDWLDFYWRRFLFLCKRGIRYLSIGNTPLQAGDMSTIRPPAVIVFGDVLPLPWYTKKEYRNLYTETTALLRLFFSSLFPFLRASMEFIKNNTELYAM